jgi:uncharacterized protein (TIRG00374 family)
MKRYLILLVKAILSLGLLGLLVWIMRKDIGRICWELKQVNLFYFIFAFLLYLVAMVAISIRWQLILATHQTHLGFKKVVALNFIGIFFNNFFPTSVGGDVVKAFYTSRLSQKNLESYAAVLFDRFIGLVTIFFLSGLALPFVYRNLETHSLVFIVILIIFSLFSCIFLFNRAWARNLRFLLTILRFFQLEQKLRRAYDVLHSYTKSAKVIRPAFIYSVLAQIVSIISIYLLALAISAKLDLGILFAVIPIIGALSMLPSLNGLGIRENAYVIFLGGVMGKEKAFTLSLLFLSFLVLTSIIGGMIYIFRDHILGKACSGKPKDKLVRK